MKPKWITFNEVLRLTGLKRRTAERRLKSFRERHPELFKILSRKVGNRMIYQEPSIIYYLSLDPKKLGKEKTDREILQELFPEKEFGFGSNKYEYLYELETFADEDGTITYRSQIHKKRDKSREKVESDNETVTAFDEPFQMSLEDRKLLESVRSREDKQRLKTALSIIESYTYSRMTIEQSAAVHGVTARTFQRWIKKMSYMSDKYARAKVLKKMDKKEHIEDCLEYEILRMSSGYNVELPTIYYDILHDMTGILFRVPKRVVINTKHIQKNVRAAMFWLRNNCPEKYPFK